MTLSEKDAKLFYRLWLPLLAYVNEECEIWEDLWETPDRKRLNPEKVMEVADVIWDDVSIIDAYLSDRCADMPDKYKEIIAGWKRCVRGLFAMERHLKKGTIFISEDGRVYQVQGITTGWEEMFAGCPLPVLMKATLIPFKGVIISDGLIFPLDIVIGNNMARQYKETYMNARENNTIIKTL